MYCIMLYVKIIVMCNCGRKVDQVSYKSLQTSLITTLEDLEIDTELAKRRQFYPTYLL